MRLFTTFVLSLLLSVPALAAFQERTFGDLKVHYSAFNSSYLQPNEAAAAGLPRSKNIGLLNITVLKDGKGQLAKVSGSVKNLLSVSTPLEFKQVLESGAVYYFAQYPVDQRETLTFTVDVQVGSGPVNSFTFTQEVFPDL